MELRQLTYFKAVAEHGSISAAARSLHLSQPPLSVAINQLEIELGVRLLDRTAKGITLTKAGNVFYQHANDILERSFSAVREVSMITDKKLFRIGITPTVVPVITPYLAKLVKADPSIHLELFEGDTYHLKELLNDGTLDAAVIRTPVNLQGCQYLRIKEEPMVAVSKKTKANKVIALKALQQEPLILYRRYEPLIQETFDAYNYNRNVVCECEDARTALSLAKEGLGTAIVPMTIAKIQNECAIYRIKEKELKTSILLAWHLSSPTLAALTQLLTK